MPSYKVVGGISLFALVFGLGLLIGIAPGFNYVLHKKMVLTPDADTFDLWANPTAPKDKEKWGEGGIIHLNAFLFAQNWDMKWDGCPTTKNQSRPEFSYINFGGLPNLTAVGPFRYREYRRKENITFWDDKVGFTMRKLFYPAEGGLDDQKVYWIPSGANGALAAKCITNPDLIPTLAMNVYSDIPIIPPPFINVTARQVVFGYEDPTLVMLKPSAPDGLIPTTTVSPFLNDTGNGLWLNQTIRNTGKNNIHDIHQYEQWSGYNNLSWWGTPDAQKVRGTDGSQFAPGVKKDEPLYIFDDYSTRVMKLRYVGESSVKGIPTYRFGIDPSVWEDMDTNPENVAYSNRVAGLMNASQIPFQPVYGAPIFASKPFFMGTGGTWLRERAGIKELPDPEIHESYMDIEPITGILLQARARVQMNIQFQGILDVPEGTDGTPAASLPYFQNTQYGFWPLLWIEEQADLDDKVITFIKSQLKLRKAAMIGGYVVGAALVAASLALMAWALMLRHRLLRGGYMDIGVQEKLQQQQAQSQYQQSR